jgi:hypothetical protein
MRWAEREAVKGTRETTYRSLVGKLKERKRFEDLNVDGRVILN